MGNNGTKLTGCFFNCSPGHRRSQASAAVTTEPYEGGFGHSFSYVRSEPLFHRSTSSKIHHSDDSTTTFRSISGAAISANLHTPTATATATAAEAAFQSSSSFFSAPLLPHPCQPKAAAFQDAGDNLNLHWAQGRAGEDRVHLVISEEQSCLFAGIYDGFNGPDATDYLLSNLYPAVQHELNGLMLSNENNQEKLDLSSSIYDSDQNRDEVKSGMKSQRSARNWEETNRRWKHEFSKERSELDSILRKDESHLKVLKAMSRALKKTERAFLQVADMIVSENPELALMGSCVLVMIMKGEDVYLMNVGDSRAVLAQEGERNLRNLERINEETLLDDQPDGLKNLVALQLTRDHCTGIEEEVRRIRSEHPEDALAVMNDRVKGSLKVTRAFGAGFLKQPKWNNALLEMFKIDYIGTSPYITCSPFLYHHRLSSRDSFLILSSDGLYQYFTNEEAVAEIELFITKTPEGDPAQHLVQQVLYRAAKKAGMDFHELLEIPQGDRRRYHDDVSVVIISFEGRIWRSCT
ncbi:probable protein phosphatase 2C 23 [Dendrobium catenatum]|uniref:probable protein phosphatase 2C 23 n=1 Tax=Dendrobium catenatum TaxID=906689 RepID=UPI0010A02FB2|nr:probable protein phosphatase 2C 23 [Dendrobium catenatum]